MDMHNLRINATRKLAAVMMTEAREADQWDTYLFYRQEWNYIWDQIIMDKENIMDRFLAENLPASYASDLHAPETGV